MEETSAISLELVVVALIALAVLLGFAWYALNNKLKAVSEQINSLQKDKEDLQKQLAAQQKTMPQEPMAAGKKNPIVQSESAEPVQSVRVPSSVETRTVQSTESAEVSDELSPDVVAAIIAAISVCGYDPSAIRTIRPQKRDMKNRGWVMAGRLAGMR